MSANGNNWLNWFRSWLVRHPVKSPPEFARQGYTEEVMRRIQGTPAAAPVLQIFSPRFAFALAAAGILAVILLSRPASVPTKVSTPELLAQVENDGLLLAELGESPDLENGVLLEEELREADRLMLAEAVPQREDAVETFSDMLDILLEEGNGSDLLEEETENDRDLLKELEKIDNAELGLA